MDENQQILKDQFNKLPQTLRYFISKGNWSSLVSDIAKKFNLDQEKYASFENEILFVLIGLQPKSDFTENIKRELEIDANIAGFIAEDVEKNIFSKVANELDEMWKNEEEQVQPKETQPQNSVGTSFEQIILNQAKAMQPARPAGWVPQNLPTGSSQQQVVNSKEEEKPKVIHNYMGEGDPYREPIS